MPSQACWSRAGGAILADQLTLSQLGKANGERQIMSITLLLAATLLIFRNPYGHASVARLLDHFFLNLKNGAETINPLFSLLICS